MIATLQSRPAGLRTSILASALLLFLAIPAQAQYEPEFFTARKAFIKAVEATPPNVAEMVSIVAGYYDHRDALQAAWAQRLGAGPTSNADRQRKLKDLLDALDRAFDANEKAKGHATTFVRLHEEMLGRKTPPKDIDEAGAVLLERLSKLPKPRRDMLRDFGKQVTSVVNEWAGKTEKD